MTASLAAIYRIVRHRPAVKFANDSSLEGAVSCELFSGGFRPSSLLNSENTGKFTHFGAFRDSGFTRKTLVFDYLTGHLVPLIVEKDQGIFLTEQGIQIPCSSLKQGFEHRLPRRAICVNFEGSNRGKDLNLRPSGYEPDDSDGHTRTYPSFSTSR